MEKKEKRIKRYCYRCGDVSNEIDHIGLSWAHDIVEFDENGNFIGSSYCCEDHHGRYSQFLKRFLPVIENKKEKIALLERIKKALKKEIEKYQQLYQDGLLELDIVQEEINKLND